MSMCRAFSCVVGRVFAMTSAFSWQNSISLCPASFCTPRPKLPVTPGVSWLPTFTPITSWQIEGEKVEAVTDFLFLSSKITVDSDCRHKLKMLAPLKESYNKPRQCIKKQRHHFADKGPYSQSYGFFPVVMYRCESWTIKKLSAFELWYWRRLLRVSWTEKRSNQSILKETNHEYSLEDLMLKLQYFGHMM